MTKQFLLLLVVLMLCLALFSCGGDDDDDDSGNGDDGVDDDDSGDDDSSDDDDDNADDDSADDDDAADDDDSDDDDTVPGDMVATLTDNPGCVLSCVVTWTTDEPATSWVKFGEDGEGYSLKIGDDTLTTDHEVVVVGMHAEVSYDLVAVSETESKQTLTSQKMSFTAGSLPRYWMTGTVDVYDESKVNDGWTITNLFGKTMSNELVAAIWDMDGYVVWYYMPSGMTARADTDVSWLADDDYVLIGPSVGKGQHPQKVDLKGDVIWEGPLQMGNSMDDDNSMHHVFNDIGNGNIVVAFNDVRNNIVGDEIVVIDDSLNEVWTWNFWDHLTPSGGFNWTHVNSVSFDLDNDYAYISSYSLGLVFKVDMQTDNIVWEFGRNGDFGGDSSADYPWFSGSHGIDYLGDGKLLMYDNGDVARSFSRAVLYQLDENTMESTLLWEYSGENAADQWFNTSVGDADLLDNGNILICAGNGSQNQALTRYIEVTPAGEKVWQMWTYNQGQTTIGSFQVDRMPALAQPID